MTANAFDEDRKEALEYGMNGFLSKPIVVEELIDALQKKSFIEGIQEAMAKVTEVYELTI